MDYILQLINQLIKNLYYKNKVLKNGNKNYKKVVEIKKKNYYKNKFFLFFLFYQKLFLIFAKFLFIALKLF